ncbi:hypothetical protein NP493_5718g00007 [Ridgeia piscesae]|uniref:Uncharacterized protein n=1 Tax=Ridgeia piscesae TaxID=27915 RepID=A0AAD9ITE8_RIDPI|nr:hypothetical protein NP493_5718g00007 [Ridgeia piscesae]
MNVVVQIFHIFTLFERNVIFRLDHNTHHCLCQHTGGDTSSLQGALFCSNTDRLTMDNIYGLGQMSVESTWSLLGLLDRDQLLDTVDSSSVATDTGSSTTGLLQPLRSRSVSPPSPLTDAAKTRSSVIGGLDIHSCLQFLLDLYGQVLSPLATPRTPLMQLNATIRSVVMLSDLFTERPQFEWMFKILLELLHSHPLEDELISQYLVIGVCKAAAILGVVRMANICFHLGGFVNI